MSCGIDMEALADLVSRVGDRQDGRARISGAAADFHDDGQAGVEDR
jgi:hypothetical protein